MTTPKRSLQGARRPWRCAENQRRCEPHKGLTGEWMGGTWLSAAQSNQLGIFGPAAYSVDPSRIRGVWTRRLPQQTAAADRRFYLIWSAMFIGFDRPFWERRSKPIMTISADQIGASLLVISLTQSVLGELGLHRTRFFLVPPMLVFFPMLVIITLLMPFQTRRHVRCATSYISESSCSKSALAWSTRLCPSSL